MYNIFRKKEKEPEVRVTKEASDSYCPLQSQLKRSAVAFNKGRAILEVTEEEAIALFKEGFLTLTPVEKEGEIVFSHEALDVRVSYD